MGNRQSEEQPAQEDDSSSPRLYQLAQLGTGKLPIIYSPDYNISFWGLQNIHPFDSGKWGKVYNYLIEGGMIKDGSSIVTPHEVNESELLVVHTDKYLKSLTSSANVAMVVEVPPVAILPNSIVQNRLLRPFRMATGGTIMAGKLAMERGWAINIGGGFHHCSSTDGGGFCAYADISLSIKFMFNHMEKVAKVMIIDLDAHQGNGHERDFLGDERVYILDMYNKWIYPNDRHAKDGISSMIELDVHTRDEEYLDLLNRGFPKSLDTFQPDIVVYNAGTDVLIGDSLGRLDITPEGVIQRDQIVFEEVQKRNIPIFMVTSGGYQKNNARVIADSILNLSEKKLISNPKKDTHVTSELRTQGAPLESNVDVTIEDSVGIEPSGSMEQSVREGSVDEPNLDTVHEASSGGNTMDHPPQEIKAVSGKEEATKETAAVSSEEEATKKTTAYSSMEEVTKETTAYPSMEEATKETTDVSSEEEATKETAAVSSEEEATKETAADPSKEEATNEVTADPSEEEAATADPSEEEATTADPLKEEKKAQENETILPQETELMEHDTL